MSALQKASPSITAAPAAMPVAAAGGGLRAASVDGSPSAATDGAPAAAQHPLFFNRELSWLDFNARVLELAEDPAVPVLERVRFLAIFARNLDEFFMKRVGGLQRQRAARVSTRSIDGLTPEEQLEAVRVRVRELLDRQIRCWYEQLHPLLKQHGIRIYRYTELSEADRAVANEFFRRHVYPILTPLSVDPGHPFPFISNLSKSLGVMIAHPTTGEKSFVRIKLPENLTRWIPLPPQSPEQNVEATQLLQPSTPAETEGHSNASPLAEAVAPATGTVAPTVAPPAGPQLRFVPLEGVVGGNLPSLFPGMNVLEHHLFRVTRNADIEMDEEDADDLLEMVELELRQRRMARVVRLELPQAMSIDMRDFLCDELAVEDDDVYALRGPVDMDDLMSLCEVDRPELKFEPWKPLTPVRLADDEADIFTIIRAGDLLVHHPYESFAASVERFVKEAADDPAVLAIKMTLYRTSPDSPFVPALIKAAEAGKQVAVLVEVKARFDEHRNVEIAQKLEKAGVHVVYGVVGFKTHTKLAMAVREERDSVGSMLRTYCHIGTGNYNSRTAQLYTDVGLFTCDPAICGDVIELFHSLTGRSLHRDYRRLLVAPVNMRQRFMQLIETERKNAEAGKPARITAKMNQLQDELIIAALYEASRAGVQIDLIVRGFCCLRPGVPALSQNIRVISILGRFLEHTRIFRFHNDGRPRHFISSADWMVRNLDYRVETTAPVTDANATARLDEILDCALAAGSHAWELTPDGQYIDRDGEEDYQRVMMRQALEADSLRPR